MPSSDPSRRHLRWRLAVGDRLRTRRRWPLGLVGAGLSVLPDGARPVPGPGDRVTRLAVLASSVDWLRWLLDHPAALILTRRVVVTVEDWWIPQRGWSGRLGPLPHLLRQRIRMPRTDRGRAGVEVELRWSVPLREVLAAVLPVLTPVRPVPAPLSAELAVRPPVPAWLGTGPATLDLGTGSTPIAGDGRPGTDEIYPYDLLLLPERSAGAPVGGGSGRPDGGASATGVDPDGSTGVNQHEVVLVTTRYGAGVGRPTPAALDPADPAALDSAALDPADPAALDSTALDLADSDPGAAATSTVLIDAGYAVVRGRYGPFGPGAGPAELVFDGPPDAPSWQITGPSGTLYAGRLDRPGLTDRARAALAGTGLVVHRPDAGRPTPPFPPVSPPPLTPPVAAVSLAPPAPPVAALLAHLAAAGILVHVPDLSAACAAALGAELRDSLTAELPGPGGDSLAWEIRTVAQRRAVLRQHACGLVLPRLAGALATGTGPPSVSALLVTRRPERVLAAVAAIEAQTYPNLEIVLCLHGVDPQPGLRTRLARCARPIDIMTVPAGRTFGEAAGLATARARGSLVTKFDDDDSYGPEHVWDLVLARHHSGATLVGKAAEFVRLESLGVTVRRGVGAAESFADTVAGGTILIARGDLEQVGGWRPVPRSIDLGLIDRVRRSGGLVYRTHPLGYVYHRRPDGHTWAAELEYFLRGAGAQWSGLPGYPEFGAGPVERLGPAPQGRRLPNSRRYPGRSSNRQVTN